MHVRVSPTTMFYYCLAFSTPGEHPAVLQQGEGRPRQPGQYSHCLQYHVCPGAEFRRTGQFYNKYLIMVD